MSAEDEQAERLQKLMERRAAKADGATDGPKAKSRPAAKTGPRKRRKATVTRAVTGGVSAVAFVSVTAAMGPVFANTAESETIPLEPTTTVAAIPTTTWAPPAVPTPQPVVAPPAPVAPTTIVVVRREYLVANPAAPLDPGAPAPAARSAAPTPAPRSNPTPSPTPAAPTPAPAPVTAAAPPAPPPPPPPPPPATPPLTSGS